MVAYEFGSMLWAGSFVYTWEQGMDHDTTANDML